MCWGKACIATVWICRMKRLLHAKKSFKLGAEGSVEPQASRLGVFTSFLPLHVQSCKTLEYIGLSAKRHKVWSCTLHFQVRVLTTQRFIAIWPFEMLSWKGWKSRNTKESWQRSRDLFTLPRFCFTKKNEHPKAPRYLSFAPFAIFAIFAHGHRSFAHRSRWAHWAHRAHRSFPRHRTFAHAHLGGSLWHAAFPETELGGQILSGDKDLWFVTTVACKLYKIGLAGGSATPPALCFGCDIHLKNERPPSPSIIGPYPGSKPFSNPFSKPFSKPLPLPFAAFSSHSLWA